MIRSLVRAAQRVPLIGPVFRTPPSVRRAVRLATDPALSQTYYPDEPRKGRWRVVGENAWWALRHGQENKFYFAYGLDRKAARLSDVLPWRHFKRLRNSGNETPGVPGNYNYVCLLRDKFVFGQIAQSLGYPAPRTLAFLDADGVEWIDPRGRAPLPSLADVEIDGFCKPFAGIEGAGAFAFRSGGGALWIDGSEATEEDLRDRLHGRSLIQERLEQHPDLSRLHPSSINTLRLVTALEGAEARPLSAVLRMGTGGRVRDNWEARGLAVAVDLATGRLRGDGMYKYGLWGGTATHHPDTGVLLDGYPLPMIDEAVRVACRFHEDLRYIHTIGWDIAFTPGGPCLVEGNDNWGLPLVAALDPGFKDRFLALYEWPGGLSRRPSRPAASLAQASKTGLDLPPR